MTKNQKTVLITGANSGIGNALAQKLIEEGYFVIGTSRSGKIENINSENIFVVELDVTKEESIINANSVIRSKFKTVDILVNNAGIALDLDTASVNMDFLKATFETNVFGLVNFTETILDCLSDGGQIINISSIMGTLDRAAKTDATAYRMSKTAVNMYTKTLSARLSNRIKVVSIHPGWVKTKLTTDSAPLTPEFSAEGIFSLLEKDLPTGTFWNAETQEVMVW